MGEERDKDQQPKTPRSRLSPYPPPLSSHQNSPVLSSCGRMEALSLPFSSISSAPPPPFKVPVSGIPWTQRREGGSHKNWAAVPSGECRPCFPYHGPPSDPYCSEPTALTSLASAEIVEALVTHPSSYRHLASASSSSCLAGEHQRPLHNNVGTTEPFT